MSKGCGELGRYAASKPSLPLSLGRYKAIEKGEGVIILSRKAYPSKVADSWDAT